METRTLEELINDYKPSRVNPLGAYDHRDIHFVDDLRMVVSAYQDLQSRLAEAEALNSELRAKIAGLEGRIQGMLEARVSELNDGCHCPCHDPKNTQNVGCGCPSSHATCGYLGGAST